MFLVGLELDTRALQGQVGSTVTIALASIVAPFAAGAALAVYLYPLVSSPAVEPTGFILFVGVSLSITAFPVLARILAALGITQTLLGVRALACAAVADVAVWCLLALVVGLIQARPGAALTAALLSCGFIAAALVLGRPIVGWAVRRAEARGVTGTLVAMALVGALGSAWITHVIGVHAVIGAFVAGATIPHDSRLAGDLTRSFEHLVLVLLLPAFFAFTGARTELGLLIGADGWFLCAVIIVVATLGKFGGTFVAARATGIGTRQAAALATLMNTRGLMELVVLNIGLELGVISPTLFSMLVVMALVTTLATTPIVRRLARTP
jgi:Kef-type K+ transport system membrane component KefB